MTITDSIKIQLKEFSNDTKIENAVKNKEIYKFSNLTQPQIQKLFDIDSQTIFSETNSKKHLSKMYEMIKSNFENEKTNNYLSVLLNPVKDLQIYNSRKEAFNTNFQILDLEVLRKIEELNTKVGFSKTIYVFSETISKLLYDNYRIHSFTITKQELEEMLNQEIQDFIIISEDELYIDVPVYTFKEFQKLIVGNIIKNNKSQILKFIDFLNSVDIVQAQNIIKQVSNIKFEFEFDKIKLQQLLEKNIDQDLKELTSKALNLDIRIEELNKELKVVISKKQLSLQGDELLEALNSGNMQVLQDKFKQDTKELIGKYEDEIVKEFQDRGIKIDYLFENANYPVELDPEIKDKLIRTIDKKSSEVEFEYFEELGEFNYKEIKNLWNFAYLADFVNGIYKFIKKYNLSYPILSEKLYLEEGLNMYISNPSPVSYGLGIDKVKEHKLQNEKIAVLTGANSGGKTTLLEMFLQSQILTHLGLPVNATGNSQIKLQDEVIYLKKFTGTQGSGAFEQTIRNLIEILDKDTSKLVLIDEFEAITEPGAAAKILIEFLQQLSLSKNYCISVSHLGIEIQEFIKEEGITEIRIDGISAQGLDEQGNLITNHEPQFYKLGKSTPELILKRILNDEKFWNNKSEKSRNILEKISG